MKLLVTDCTEEILIALDGNGSKVNDIIEDKEEIANLLQNYQQ